MLDLHIMHQQLNVSELMTTKPASSISSRSNDPIISKLNVDSSARTYRSVLIADPPSPVKVDKRVFMDNMFMFMFINHNRQFLIDWDQVSL